MGRASDPEERKAEAAETARNERVATALSLLDRMCSTRWGGEYELQTIKLRLGTTDEIETLCIVEGLGPDGSPVVAFNGAQTPSEALIGALNRIKNGQMKWRADEYRKK